jgi:hypothetical protein
LWWQTTGDVCSRAPGSLSQTRCLAPSGPGHFKPGLVEPAEPWWYRVANTPLIPHPLRLRGCCLKPARQKGEIESLRHRCAAAVRRHSSLLHLRLRTAPLYPPPLAFPTGFPRLSSASSLPAALHFTAAVPLFPPPVASLPPSAPVGCSPSSGNKLSDAPSRSPASSVCNNLVFEIL